MVAGGEMISYSRTKKETMKSQPVRVKAKTLPLLPLSSAERFSQSKPPAWPTQALLTWCPWGAWECGEGSTDYYLQQAQGFTDAGNPDTQWCAPSVPALQSQEDQEFRASLDCIIRPYLILHPRIDLFFSWNKRIWLSENFIPAYNVF